MLIRPRCHFVALYLSGFYATMALVIFAFKQDHFLVPLYSIVAILLIFAWATSYTTLSEGLLTKRVLLFFVRCFPVGDIDRITPHEKHGKWGHGRWGYGTVVTIFTNHGTKMTLQPNHSEPFLNLLREQAPQAAYLL